jgi:septum formation protein
MTDILQARAPELILASTSESRARMLRAAGLRFRQTGSGVDETALKAELAERGVTAPSALAVELARTKARAVSKAHPNVYVIGADQVLDVAGAAWDKPGDRGTAREQLLAMRGGEHSLHTAVCAARGGVVVWEAIDSPRIKFRAYSEAFLDTYLAIADPGVFQCAGACEAEGLGAHLLERIDGDFFSVLGLPVLPLFAHLRAAGVLQE